MKEDFLHYIWRFKKFDFNSLQTSRGENLTIENVGSYLENAGPDFFNGQITIGGQKWAGNIELHLKSSDWYLHHHEQDVAYENVILHVVWEHDVDVFRKNNVEIPVLVLKQYVSQGFIDNFQKLTAPKSWIYCENQIQKIDEFTYSNWLERLFIERLERKQKPIDELFLKLNKDWEAVLFCLLAKNFGLNTNGMAFLDMAENIPFSIVRKEAADVLNLEALFFGFCGLLDIEKEDLYYKELQNRFGYLVLKHQLDFKRTVPLQFFKLRPDNFPNIRLSQFAQVFSKNHHLFSNCIAVKSMQEVVKIFDVAVSEYWKTHYTFDKESPRQMKKLSVKFIELVMINTIIPMQFAYFKSRDEEVQERLMAMMHEIKPESNAIIDKFKHLGLSVTNAFETQSLLQLKNEYCNMKKCLSCSIGIHLLNSTKEIKND
ncbi:DUF2851 family protein [Flavobacterium sp. SM2513]|uniref:DUF2851 family protein n=1 Tax=Flavobacterium sp. SM2513 TaxID=3424766 RepID=UPI003D7FCA3E